MLSTSHPASLTGPGQDPGVCSFHHSGKKKAHLHIWQLMTSNLLTTNAALEKSCVHEIRSLWHQGRYTCCEMKLQWHKTIILVATESLACEYSSSATTQEMGSLSKIYQENHNLMTNISLFYYSHIKIIYGIGMIFISHTFYDFASRGSCSALNLLFSTSFFAKAPFLVWGNFTNLL